MPQKRRKGTPSARWPHFPLAEFVCRDGCGYGRPLARLRTRLERLRAQIGDKPIAITSGVRCPLHNATVGGAARSRHCSGEAADIPPGLVTEQDARRAGFTGIGLSGKWVTHVDVRRGPVTVWRY